MADARFGRNAPLAQTFGEQPPSLYEPNPRVISRDLLARRDFVPATTVNLFLAAWLQFMVHDWLSHGGNDTQNPPLRFPVPAGDDWPKPEMTILRTRPDHQRGPRDEGRPATYRNIVTHWWDGSQMYGSDLQMQHCVRSSPAKVLLPDGKLYLDETGHLPLDPEAADDDPLESSPPSTATGGSDFRLCTRCSRASTIRSSIACISNIPTRTASGCSRRPD